MTRSELITALACRFPNLMAKDAEIAVKEILDAMSVTLVQGNRVEIRGFGSFGLNYRPARNARNPKTDEKILVSPKYVPHFKAGKEMRDRVEASVK
ncbi:MAG: integration host factor subunit beta [Nitrosomonas ureae]